MRYVNLLNIIPCLFLLFSGCDNNPTIVTDYVTINSYYILNNTNSELLSKTATFRFAEADSVFELPAGQRVKLFKYLRMGKEPTTPEEALKKIEIFQDSAGVMKQVYLQDPLNNSLWVLESEGNKNEYKHTLVIDMNDIK